MQDDVQEEDLSLTHLKVERKAWIPRFFKMVEADSYTRDALAFLVTGGMDRKQIASILFWYTNPRSEYLQRRVSSLAKSHVKMLDAIQKALWDCQQSLDESEVDRMTAPSSWPVKHIEEAAEVMLEASVYAADLAYRLRPLSSAKGKSRNEEVIVSLCLQTRAVTGKPHWMDIASLLKTAWQVRGLRRNWDQDRLRKVFNRYRDSYPPQFRALKAEADGMKDEAGPSVGQVTRSTRNRRTRQPKSNENVARGAVRLPDRRKQTSD